MRVELDDREQLLALRDYLRQLGCLAFINENTNSLDVHADPPDPQDERVQIQIWVDAWNQLNSGQARPRP